MNQQEFDKQIARAVARNRSIDPETRLALARKFDPSIKSVNEGMYEDYKRYEESIIHTHRKPEPIMKTEVHKYPDGSGYDVIVTKNGEYVRTAYSSRESKPKDGAK